jgi:hypothetical protein
MALPRPGRWVLALCAPASGPGTVACEAHQFSRFSTGILDGLPTVDHSVSRHRNYEVA